MAKATKAKARPVSTRSRAARREASPGIDLDKSITSEKTTKEPSEWTSGAHDAGISKKKKQKNMTRAQRVRKEKGLERAEANMDVLHTKKAKSFVRARRIDDRRANWETLNDKTNRFVQPKAAKGSKAVDFDANSSDEEHPGRPSVFAMPGDEEDDEVEQHEEAPNTADPVNNVAANDDDDEIL
ncbi:unnamed protein product [Aureobasidium pullulans]|uniref:Alb1-domain-containing protein n=2 Tax=Aureobasidium pullulans TaxID=5580 RepID=A0A074YD47_AURPU|nr:uncharacterized protein M438DRAFT_396674 [Aureobasidium pullulans EXF-150]OBW68649.1 MAG: Uncharacterized protein AUREO_013030 [Aureobasidium pullulans]KEQ84776.1 hypothetical protein M438DRAFT_396674 [Aureobasidium pullulans EXF-150]THV68883.1 hypothetical protein D6D28_06313 [Aureobasidium pullulans]THV82405.1 hypothetical protein D6D29_04671 [Aureobasidium pullulans]THW16955.1 hypothetical protein D6D23_08330 [Aureobasidium pullulans]